MPGTDRSERRRSGKEVRTCLPAKTAAGGFLSLKCAFPETFFRRNPLPLHPLGRKWNGFSGIRKQGTLSKRTCAVEGKRRFASFASPPCRGEPHRLRRRQARSGEYVACGAGVQDAEQPLACHVVNGLPAYFHQRGRFPGG